MYIYIYIYTYTHISAAFSQGFSFALRVTPGDFPPVTGLPHAGFGVYRVEAYVCIYRSGFKRSRFFGFGASWFGSRLTGVGFKES